MIRPATSHLLPFLALVCAIANANWGYFAFPIDLQPRIFRIDYAALVMVLCGLGVIYGPRLTEWAIVWLWGYAESWQSAVCRIATFDQAAPGGSMLCVGLLGVKPYQALLAASVVLLVAGAIKPWPRR